MNKIKLALILVAVGVFSYYIISMFSGVKSSFSKRFVSEPKDYKEILKNENSNLLYKYTLSKDSIFPVSIYTYDKSKYAIILFKRKAEGLMSLEESSFFYDKVSKKSSNKVYTNFLSLDELNFSYEDNDNIAKLNFFIENFSNGYIKEKTKNRLYLSFPLKNTFGMSFNSSDKIDLQCNPNVPNFEELNELMIVKKEDFLYFIYIKPFYKDSNKRLILKEIVN
ncbi:hypothetical protein V1T75_07940 [Tenacibaculum sp. FZY0031]|uniref:hypothetical protein n=1 Tax=Tenacibaculum sp. FZY0031 TaxID=3116648 RepID=UPI002EA1D344|nr:hypothetical protein [Tenacibaculum sp. FZY0031]